MAKVTKTTEVTRGSGNVFADLGFENPEEELAKAILVLEIARALAERRTTQARLAEMIGTDQPSISRLLRGRTGGYTIDRLARILTRLGKDVEITVRPTRTKGSAGRVFVSGKAARDAGIGDARLVAKGAVKEPKARYSVKAKRAGWKK